ncbi:MAG: PD-(D/E)XK nuclease family protein, partial [Candidatus Sericytochromatia bacterium]
PELGAALKLEVEDDEAQPVLTTVLMRQQGRQEKEERKRVFYVALTRARDHLLLGATDEKGGAMDFLVPGFEAASVPIEVIPFDPQDARPESPPEPPPPPEPSRLLLHAVGPGLVELPVTALSEFQRCPKRFKLQYLDGHPGLPEGSGYAARVGTLVHLALEQGLQEAAELGRFDPTLPPEAIDDAVALVRRFQEEACYEPFRDTIRQREHPFQLKLGRLVLNGIVDGVGDDYVLDYKTDREIHPEHHRFQLWAYAEALNKPKAHLAYLRHGHVETYEAKALDALGTEACRMAEAILKGPYPARPVAAVCTRCPYGTVCEEQAAHAPAEAVSPFLPGLREELPLGVPSPQEWVQVVARAEGAEAWRLVQIAPGRHAAALLARLAASGWTPEDAVRHAAFEDLCRLAAACEPRALETMPQPDGVSLRMFTDTGPYAISAEDLALVEAGYGAVPLEATQRAWVDFWLALARWHQRFEAQVEERLEEVPEVGVVPLLE